MPSLLSISRAWSHGAEVVARHWAFAPAGILSVAALFLVNACNKPSPVVPPAVEAPQGAGAEERAYATSVGVDHLVVSRAENFLHQEVTTISGEITNGGGRPLASVELSIEFSDEQNQTAQRETRNLFGPPGPAIQAGDHREFEVSFEHISNAWNLRAPAVKVTGVQFAAQK